MLQLGASIPVGTRLTVPYDGMYELGGKGQAGSAKAAVRVAEVLSLRRLFKEGEMLSSAPPLPVAACCRPSRSAPTRGR